MSPVRTSSQVSQPMPALPVARFRKIVDDNPRAAKNKLAGVHDQQAQSFGYNKPGELFVRPAQYIHYVEPLESELAVRVEYDLDEQDQEWIDALNAERKKEQLDTVTYEIFEVIMDRLEKEYFELMKHVPKPENALPSEDSTCSVCDDGEGENSNVIVFCDGCNLAVHQDCYGVPYIPEGQWLCRKCTVSPESPVSCVLCPNEGGAFKQTPTGQWVHLLCAIWIPEVNVANMTFMEPIENVNRIPKNRLKLTCSICRSRGPCIQCDNKSCFAAFHVTCARQQKFLAPMKAMPGVDEAPPLRAFCEKHLPSDLADARLEALEALEAMDAAPSSSSPSSRDRKGKAARAYAKSYNLGPPLVPWIVVEHILAYLTRVRVRKTREFVLQVCKYWSLKREARRGAPLLKRLHLEPWTTTAVDRNIGEEQRRMKLEVMTDMRTDLEKLRLATGMIKQREKGKKSEAILVYELLETFLFPHEAALRRVFDRVSGLDRAYFFRSIISRDEAPDYYELVSNPLCWNEIDDRLDRHEYWNVQAFIDDINLVLDNAMLYNKKDTAFYKTAEKIKAQAAPLLASLHDLSLQQPVHSSYTTPSNASRLNEEVKTEPSADGTPSVQTPSSQIIGDLEPTLDLLRLLCEKERILNDPALMHELNKPPVEALLSFENLVLKPPKNPTTVSKDTSVLREEQTPTSLNQMHPTEARPLSPPSMDTTNSSNELNPAPVIPIARSVSQLPPPPVPKAKGKKAARGRKARAEKNINVEVDSVAPGNIAANGSVIQLSGNITQLVDSTTDSTSPVANAKVEPEPTPEATETPRPPESSSSSAVVEAIVFEPVTSAELSPSPMRPGVKRKRAQPDSTSLVIPDVVSNVDNRSSFAMFNQGWVLDASMRRGGRQAPDPSASPVHKKARKGDVPRSRLSVVATPVEDNETLGFVDASTPPSVIHEAGVTQTIPTEQTLTGVSVQDEPSYSRETQSVEIPTNSSIEAIKSPEPSAPLFEEHATATSLDTVDPLVATSLAIPLDIPTSRQQDKKPRTSRGKFSIRVAPVRFEEGKTTLDHGTLVWAKLPSYAWFPAIVHDDDDPLVPPAVRAKRPKNATDTHLVLFVDTMQWAWVQQQFLQMLGDDRDADTVILQKQRYKGTKERNDVLAAYRSAIAQIAPEGYEPSIDEELGHELDPGTFETSQDIPLDLTNHNQ